MSGMLHDIFAACELYRRLRARVRNANIAGICYRTMSHKVETSSTVQGTPPEATIFRYLDTLWQLEDCMGQVAETLGERDYWIWSTCRLLGAETPEEGWALWKSLPWRERPRTLPAKGYFFDCWQSYVRLGDLVLDRALQEGRLLKRAG